MKRTILAILMTLMVVAPTQGLGIPFSSVEAIGQVIYPEDGSKAYFGNVCTAASINQKQHYWLTAYHCIEEGAPHYIAGQPVQVVMKDVTNDLAIVVTPVLAAPALKLATTPPATRDHVIVIGHPLGQIFPVVTEGPVAAERVIMGEKPYTLLQVPGAPGSSGSPVLNVNNEIVSVILRGPSPSTWGAVMAGSTFEKLEGLRLWWEK